jgi:hypothetical protein
LANSLLGHKVFDLPGADLSPLIMSPDTQQKILDPSGEPREAILFVTDDDITAPLSNEYGDETFHYYLANVEALRKLIEINRDHPEQLPSGIAREYLPKVLYPGTVVQPNHVQSARTGDWKLVRYWDPAGTVEDEWELYDLAADRQERTNLVTWAKGEPILNDAGKAHPKAKEALPYLRVVLNKKLREAGYPEAYLHPDLDPGKKSATA